MKIWTLSLSDAEIHALETILEFYIRLGLGQLSEIGTRLSLLVDRPGIEEVAEVLKELETKLTGGKPWKIEDPETSTYTLMAYEIQAKVQKKPNEFEWAFNQLSKRRKECPPHNSNLPQ